MADVIINDVITAGFHKAHMRAFVYSSCHVCYNKMYASESSLYV